MTPESLSPQQNDADDAITFFAQTTFRNEFRRFGIKTDDRRRHVYIIGKTGMGKSTLLENMIIQDIQEGRGLAVADPHGDLVEKVLDFIPSHRINDVVYFNPSDIDHPIAFNIFENISPELKNLVANGLVGVFKKIWADSWGPRLEYILINSILALLEYPGSTLLGVTRMLVDPKYRKKIVQNIQDPIVKSFWISEYNNYSEKFRNEAIAPIQNKVGQFLSSSLIRNIVGQSKSSINVREIMDQRKILLMNLSKGRIGEENAALLGAMMVTKIQLAAMSRVDIPEEERRDFYLYVDEFQNFATESFANILSEARKYRLNIIMAHQYVEQLSDEVKAAVFGNAGTIISFRVGSIDAEQLELEFQPTFMQEDLVTLAKYNVYLRLMIDGAASTPFSAMTLPPAQGRTSNREKVIDVSREHYSQSREEVEEKIRRWAEIVSEETAREVSAAAEQQYGYGARRRPMQQSRPTYYQTPSDNAPRPFVQSPQESQPQASVIPKQSQVQPTQNAQTMPESSSAPQPQTSVRIEQSTPVSRPPIPTTATTVSQTGNDTQRRSRHRSRGGTQNQRSGGYIQNRPSRITPSPSTQPPTNQH